LVGFHDDLLLPAQLACDGAAVAYVLGVAGSRVEIGAGYEPQLIDRGSGPAVILVHGTPLDAHCWDRLDLPARRLIAYDLRGHGSAEASAPASSYDQLVDDLATLLDRLELDQAEILGHSFGGQVAQSFAARFPERTRRLWVACSRCAPFPPFEAMAERIDEDGAAAVGAEAIARWFSADDLAGETEGVRYARACIDRANPSAFAGAFRLIAPFSLPVELMSAPFPVTFIAAERDPIASAEVLAEGARKTGGKLILAPGAGHMLPVEDPKLLSRLISGPPR
jgi:3-oxoadipate enol-lactonase